ncbi:UPF0005-domain-containing protein [Mycena vulgaris]|nr:UPF0005-domain-containing protein [Mycena vulgaris]
MSQYPVPPPTYSTHAKDAPEFNPWVGKFETVPLLASLGSHGGGVFDQPDASDVPADYRTTVSESAPQIRKAFIRKVYTILLSQILATAVVAGFFFQSSSTLEWVKNHLWAFFVPLSGTIVNAALLYWKRHTHPWNLILLSTFTLAEVFTIGIAVAFFDNMVVLRALLIILAVFIGLTLFTLQSKYDFSGIGPFLFAALIAICTTFFVHFVVAPFDRTLDVVYAGAGCIVLSACVVYDTYRINARLSPDKFIVGAISLSKPRCSSTLRSILTLSFT